MWQESCLCTRMGCLAVEVCFAFDLLMCTCMIFFLFSLLCLFHFILLVWFLFQSVNKGGTRHWGGWIVYKNRKNNRYLAGLVMSGEYQYVVK